jgi:hypothetical protein
LLINNNEKLKVNNTRDNTKVFFLPKTSAIIPEGSSSKITDKAYNPNIIDKLLKEAPLSIKARLSTGVNRPVKYELRNIIKE